MEPRASKYLPLPWSNFYLSCNTKPPAWIRSQQLAKLWGSGWIAGGAGTGETEPKPGGYRWKMLYLPPGTRLSVLERGEFGFAYVVDDRLIYHGEDITPNQFARMAPTT